MNNLYIIVICKGSSQFPFMQITYIDVDYYKYWLDEYQWLEGWWTIMKTNTIITIGRQYGSAGREIGSKVAEAFGIKLYDKEMLARASVTRASWEKTETVSGGGSTPGTGGNGEEENPLG